MQYQDLKINTQNDVAMSDDDHMNAFNPCSFASPTKVIKNRNLYSQTPEKNHFGNIESPTRQNFGQHRDETFEKLLMAPVKPNNTAKVDNLFVMDAVYCDQEMADAPKQFVAAETIPKGSYDSPIKERFGKDAHLQQSESENICWQSTEYTQKKSLYQSVTASKFIFRDDDSDGEGSPGMKISPLKLRFQNGENHENCLADKFMHLSLAPLR